jgi:ketosteroid isomerase-like protein
MSEENVELSREAYDAYNRDGVTGILGFLDPEIEWRNLIDSPIAGVFIGHAGVLEWERLVSDSFEEMHFEPERITELSDGRIVARLRFRFRARGSEIEIEVPFAHLITFRDGKAISLQMYSSENEALEAAGLSE